MSARRITEDIIFRGRLINVSRDTVLLSNDRQIELDIVHHPGGAVVVALNEHREVCLLRQVRYAVSENALWELPAGCIDADDASPLATAKRELAEEAGVLATSWQDLGHILTSPGFCNEKLYLYLARGLTQCEPSPHDDEIIEVNWIGFEKAIAMAANGKIADAKTVAGLFRTQQILRE